MPRRPAGSLTHDAYRDVALALSLDAEVDRHEQSAERARSDRRAVWLRLYETHGLTYEQLQEYLGYGNTTFAKELRRAREL